MICGKCKADIDNDSIYCDQCGEELFICPKCGNPGRGKICTQDGTKLVSAKELNRSSQNSGSISSQQAQKTASANKTVASQPQDNSAQSVLSLINKSININISPQNGDIIGRRTGNFTSIFGSYNEVSGTHAKVSYSPQLGWQITDLGSSNGTKYNGKDLTPNVPQKIENKSFVQIANIEFYVQIM